MKAAIKEIRDHLESRVKATAELKQHWLMHIPVEQVENPPEAMMRHYTAHGENIAFGVVLTMLDKILKGGAA